MFTNSQILNIIILFTLSSIFFRIEGVLEKLFRQASISDESIFEENNSLTYLKYSLLILCFIGSIEFSDKTYEYSTISVFLLIIIIMGIILRILAIISLGKYWSFNIKIYKNHEIIKTSIYRYIKHPAYIGNVYIVGFYLFFKCYITALLSFIIIFIFGLWRRQKEEYLLKNIKNILI